MDVLTPQAKQAIKTDMDALTPLETNAKVAVGLASDDDKNAKHHLTEFEALPVDVPVAAQIVADAKAVGDHAKEVLANALKQQAVAKKIEADLTGFKPNPPVDAIGHSVQFIVNYGGSISPNWSLIASKGPSLTIPGASLTGTRTNILNIAFGPTSEQIRLLNNAVLSSALTR